MNIPVRAIDKKQEKKPPKETPVFGKVFTNYMFKQWFNQENGWHGAEITALEDITLSPSAQVFHYGQEIFEGLKAYRGVDGRILLFRARENVARFNLSANRMQMPEVDENLHFEAIKKLVQIEKKWVPQEAGASLYLRPVMIATEPTLWMPSTQYLHYIIACPTGSYVLDKNKPTISIVVEEKYKRAVKGGSGEAKTGGNYAAGLKAHKQANQNGYNQVLWLDAVENIYVEEAGTMNVFFVYKDNTIVTPELNGSILNGVTRKSTIVLANELGYNLEERKIPVKEVIDSIESGEIIEAFGTGTAASILPIGKVGYRSKDHIIGREQVGSITEKLRTRLSNIQYGIVEDPYSWIEIID